MSSARLFLPQDAIEQWSSEGTAQVLGETLVLDGYTFALEPAVRIVSEVTGAEEDHGLIGRVKSLEQLAGLGGELCAGSVVLGDSAYEVIDGFLARFTTRDDTAAEAALAADTLPGAEASRELGPCSHETLVKMLSRR